MIRTRKAPFRLSAFEVFLGCEHEPLSPFLSTHSATFDMPPILGRAQDESSSRLLHHSSVCLKRDAADGYTNRILGLRQSRWVVLVDHLLDVTPQKEIWGCQVGRLWRPADGGAL